MQAKPGGPRELELLKGITGAFQPGVLTALMGASGAGKTTFMDVLAGRKNSEPLDVRNPRVSEEGPDKGPMPQAPNVKQEQSSLQTLAGCIKGPSAGVKVLSGLAAFTALSAVTLCEGRRLLAHRREDIWGGADQRLPSGAAHMGARERLRGAERHPFPTGHCGGGALVLCAPAPDARHLQQGHVGLHLRGETLNHATASEACPRMLPAAECKGDVPMHIGADTYQIPAAAPLKCQAHAGDVMELRLLKHALMGLLGTPANCKIRHREPVQAAVIFA